MKYRKKLGILSVIMLIIFITGCSEDKKGTVSGTNYYYPSTEVKEQIQEENAVVKAELTSEHFMILENDMTKEYLILRQMESGQQYLYQYGISTNFLDKYGNNTSVSSFEPGRIITIGKKDAQGKLKSAKMSEDVWEYEDIIRFKIDEERGVFQIADTKYSFDEDLYVESAGNQITLSEIKEEDELRVVGMNKEILSVAVTTGQGTIALKNTELFEDSFIQIGNRIFAEITGEMELEVPEGTYMVTVANKGYGGSKEYVVERAGTTVIDLDELKGEGPKMGAITFAIITTDENEEADIVFKVDGEEVSYEEPVELAYGVHSIQAEAFGYETYAKKLFVNSEEATISIALDMGISSSLATDKTDDEEADNEETGNEDAEKDGNEVENGNTVADTDLAGSLAGSTSAGDTDTDLDSDSTSSTDALVEAITNVLTEDSSTDYLSTLTELLSGVM